MKIGRGIKQRGVLGVALAMQRDLIVGGQAVMEGVMMRTPGAYAVACRNSDGRIITTAERLPKWSDRHRILSLPVLRGGAVLVQTMLLGIKALNFSAAVADEKSSAEVGTRTETEGKPKQSVSAIASLAVALGFNVLLFIIAPLLVTNLLFIGAGLIETPASAQEAGLLERMIAYTKTIEVADFRTWVAFNLVDGVIRTAVFITMIFSMSYMRDIKRIFQYHGAEHKTVYAWEKGLELTPENAGMQRRQHPRCGTSFLMIVMMVAIVLFSVINFNEMWMNLVVRILLMPVVAGISYEIIKFAAKSEAGSLFTTITRPGIWLQDITTQEPDADQLEVAIVALNESLKLEPEGSIEKI
jgi:uncharacterized protein YqhQ